MIETQAEQDTQTVEALRDHAFDLIAQVKSTGRPIALTHNGTVEAILLDPCDPSQLPSMPRPRRTRPFVAARRTYRIVFLIEEEQQTVSIQNVLHHARPPHKK
jgi:hypothetical protein